MVKPSKTGSYSNSSDKIEKNKKKKKNKFSVYEFNLDDQRVEKDSKKWLSKFKTRKLKFSSSPVDKYDFLSSFAQGAKTRESYSEDQFLDIEDSDDCVEEMTCAEPSVLPDPKPSAHSPVNHLSFKNCSPEERHSSCEGRKPGHRISHDMLLKGSNPQMLNQPLLEYSDDGKGSKNHLPISVDSDDDKNHLPISVDSDDDSRTVLKSLSSAPYLARNEGLLEEKPSNHGSRILDMEPVVIVNPDIIIFGEMYSTNASVTFSDRYIKVEGTILGGAKTLLSFNWSVSDIVMIESSWYQEVETARLELSLITGVEKLAKTLEIVKLNFAICDPWWSERQEAIESLHSKYKATWKTVIDSSKAFEGIIYPQGDPDAVSISMKDVQLLQPATFINDTIIDFYIKYLEQQLEPEEKSRFHFFNSFFFRKLVDLSKSSSTACEGREAFQRVCKWTRKVDLFEKDYLFIPVNFSFHWSLIVICHPGEVARCEDKEMEKTLKSPCILHMDSIKGCHGGLKNVFQSYLLEEWRERHNELLEHVSAKFLNLPFKSLELPQQENSFDCGLFLLYFVERFLEEAPFNFNHAAACKFLNKKWFLPAEASGRRGYIKNIIYRIINDNVQEDLPVTNCYDFSQNEMEGGNDKGLLLEACNERNKEICSSPNAGKNIQITSGEASNIRMLLHSGGFNSVSNRSVIKGTYQHCRQLEWKRFRSTMSPIEDEESKGTQTSFSSDKASSRLAELTLIGTPVNNVYENTKTTSETVGGKFPTSLEIQDENHLALEVILFSASERSQGIKSSSSSSEELSAQVIEDSCESGTPGIKDNGNHSFHKADQVVDSPYNTSVKSVINFLQIQ